MPGTLPFSSKSLHINTSTTSTSEGEQSPPPVNTTAIATGVGTSTITVATSSATTPTPLAAAAVQDFAVFANVNIQGRNSSSHHLHNHTSPSSHHSQHHHHIGGSHGQSAAASEPSDSASTVQAPELPKRSNSIISLGNSIVSTIGCSSASGSTVIGADIPKPVLSPSNISAATTPSLPSSSPAAAAGSWRYLSSGAHQKVVMEPLAEDPNHPHHLQQHHHHHHHLHNNSSSFGQLVADSDKSPPIVAHNSSSSTISPRTDFNSALTAANRSPFQNTSQQSRINLTGRNSSNSFR